MMTDADLCRAARLAVVSDHLERHGLADEAKPLRAEVLALVSRPKEPEPQQRKGRK